MSISFNHPSNIVTSTSTLEITALGGTASNPNPIRLNASSIIVPVKPLPVGEMGALVFDNATYTMKYHDGTSWVELLGADVILEPIYTDLTAIKTTLGTKVDSVTYSSSAVPSASVSGTNLNIVFPTVTGGGGTGPTGLYTSLKPGTITHYALTSGQNAASIREQMSGVSGGQSGRNGSSGSPWKTSDGWCYADGQYWTWAGENGTVTKQVPNLNQDSYLKPMTVSGVTQIVNPIASSAQIGQTSLTIAQLPPHSFSVSGQTSTAGEHVHAQQLRGNDRSGHTAITSSADAGIPTVITNVNAAGNHIHTFSGSSNTIGSGQSHGHTISNIDVNHLTVAVLYNIAESSVALSEKVASTKYVLKAGDVMTGSLTIANSATIRANDTSLVLYFRNTSNAERAAIYHSSTNNTLRLRANGGSEVTIAQNGTLYAPAVTGASSSVSGAASSNSLSVSSQSAVVGGKNVVRSVNGTNADGNGNVTLSIATSSASLGQNGWHKDEKTGMITQWGYLAVNDDSYVTVNLPMAYPNACVNLQVTGRVSSVPGNRTSFAGHGNILNNSQIAVGAANPGSDGDHHGLGVYWSTIGY